MAELTLDPSKTALVTIDLQNAIVAMNTAPHPSSQVVENSRKLAEAARQKGMAVIYVRVDMNDFMSQPVDQPNPMKGPFPAEFSEIAATAGLQSGDVVVTKRSWGAFAQTNLEQELRARGIDTVIITGIATNIGVESTVRQGTGLGFNFVIVEDACSTHSLEMHRFAFENILPRLGRVRSTAEVIEAIG